MPLEFDFAGSRYRFDGIPPLVETRIARRLAPLMAQAMSTMLMRTSKPGKPLELRPDANVYKFVEGVLNRLGSLSDDDTDVVQREALRGLSRQVESDWETMWSEAIDGPAFADIDGALMMGLTIRSLGCVVKNWLQHSEDLDAAFNAGLADVLH